MNNVNVCARKREWARVVACGARSLAGGLVGWAERRRGVVVGECEERRGVVIDECGGAGGGNGGGTWLLASTK